ANRDQDASPWPPSESNTQDVICLVSGSQPMYVVPPLALAFLFWTLYFQIKKLPLSSHLQLLVEIASGPSSTQSPTIHFSSCSRSCGVGEEPAGAGWSRSIESNQRPSFFTKMAV